MYVDKKVQQIKSRLIRLFEFNWDYPHFDSMNYSNKIDNMHTQLVLNIQKAYESIALRGIDEER